MRQTQPPRNRSQKGSPGAGAAAAWSSAISHYRAWVFLYLDQPAAEDDVVSAEFMFSLLDRNDEPVHMKMTPSAKTFSCVNGYSRRWGYGRFIKRKRLESHLWSCLRLGGEAFGIRCNIAMVTSGRRKAAAAATARLALASRRPPYQRSGSGRAFHGWWPSVPGAQEHARGTVVGFHGGALRPR
ncbi:hypothetical protein E2562_024299 [Oryza meyeriana var. granulata]|uniref:MATH domain-containing protein n=1 Tax=Oryza meyeriana var. granulata TaxID=110450 RepID=A0A6G1C8F6_9ORYZ|nr:hypothetical protein E2562_024299 [Oryza meyeriana var. granulata]